MSPHLGTAPATPEDLRSPIRSARLDLLLLPVDWLTACAAGAALPDLGFADRHHVVEGNEGLVRLRLMQLAHDPAQHPWLLRMIVRRADGEAVGYANFHAPPDERGMVEIGYTVAPAERGRGYATEAATAMWRWAAGHGARVLRASVAPGNEPSLALVRRAGFVHVGEQIDEVDGLEQIWERPPL